MRFVSWNIENYWPVPHEHLRVSKISGEPSLVRIDSDYDAIRAVIGQLGGDVFGLQEMASPEAVRTLFPEKDWGLVFAGNFADDLARDPDKLSDPRKRDIYPAVVYRRTSAQLVAEERIPGLRMPEPEPDGSIGYTREGIAAKLRIRNREVWVASIHLKAFCAEVLDPFTYSNPAEPMRTVACQILAAQLPILRAWVAAKVQAGEDVVLLGDFNNQLARTDSKVGAYLNEGIPGGLIATPGDRTDLCTAFRDEPRPSIDFIMITQGLAERARRNSMPKLNILSEKISDHCPVWLDIDFRDRDATR
jgi:hypothetical protein